MNSEHHHLRLLDQFGSWGARAMDEQSGKTILFVVLASLVTALLFVLSYGSIMPPVALIGGVAVVFITFYRIDWGFMIFIGAVLICEQFPPAGYDSTTFGLEYFQNLKAMPWFSNVEMAVLNPLELHLLLIFIVWVLHIATGKKVLLQPVPVWLFALLFFFWLILSAVHGMGRGGEFLPILWELRSLFYLGLLMFFVPQIIQQREQIYALIWICVIGFSFKGAIGIIRLFVIGFHFGESTELTTHEDPLFFVSLFILFIALVIFGVKGKLRTVLAFLMFPLAVVFILAQRRATYGAFGLSIIALIILLPAQLRLKFFKALAPALIMFVLYLVIFWNSDTTIGHPAQLVKASFSTTKEAAGERYWSNLYRIYENYDLAQTLKKSPIIGIGFGNKYDQPLRLVAITYSLREYIPHNEIYWLIVKMGTLGFFFFLLFFDAYVFYAAFVYSRLQDPFLKILCALTMIAAMAQIFVSFYDLQLTFSRNMIYLGLLMGMLPTIELADRRMMTMSSPLSRT